MDFNIPVAAYADVPAPIGEIVVNGIPRKLAALQPHPDLLAAARPYGVAGFPILDQSRWVECDYSFYGVEVRDQGQTNSCTNHAGTVVLETAGRMAGWVMPRLSCTMAYAMVNGGRDQGASVSSILKVFEQVGLCTEAKCGLNQIFRTQIAADAFAEAKKYAVPADPLQGAFLIRSFNELGSALSLGVPSAFGLMIGRNFNQLDSEGVCPPPDAIIGGHALAAVGLKKGRAGRWLIKFQNSWGLNWGLRGFAYLGESSLDRMIDAYGIIMPRLTDEDPNKPPPVKVTVGGVEMNWQLGQVEMITEDEQGRPAMADDVADRLPGEPSADLRPKSFVHEDVELTFKTIEIDREHGEDLLPLATELDVAKAFAESKGGEGDAPAAEAVGPEPKTPAKGEKDDE